MRKANAIAIVNQKGGVAKTTTTVNVGVGLAKDGYRVLLIDADPQSSLTISMGIRNPDGLEVNLATVMQDIVDDRVRNPFEGIISTGESVDLMPSNILLSGMETALFNVIGREGVLKQYINAVRGQYDYILVDCAPSLSLLTINALCAADGVIIPCQPNFLSAKGMDLLIKSINKIRKTINHNLKIGGILMTMVDGRTNNARNVITALRNSVGQRIRIFEAEIPMSVRAAECSMKGVSIYTHDPNGRVAEAYRHLVKEVERCGEREKLRSSDARIR